jgi:hypothetical protein
MNKISPENNYDSSEFVGEYNGFVLVENSDYNMEKFIEKNIKDVIGGDDDNSDSEHGNSEENNNNNNKSKNSNNPLENNSMNFKNTVKYDPLSGGVQLNINNDQNQN